MERREVLERFHRRMLFSGGPSKGNHPNGIATLSEVGRQLIPGESVWSTQALIAGLDFLQTVDVRASVSAVAAPTMLVHGTDDVICPVEAGRWIADHLRDAVWIEFAGVGHVPFWKSDSQVGQRVEAFLLK